MKSKWVVVVLGALIVGFVVSVALLGDLTRSVPRFLVLFALIFVLYLSATYLLSRLHEPYRFTLICIFLVAILCRVVNVSTTPTLSTDIYRYLWEGRVIRAGQNPFVHAPFAPELEHLRDHHYPGINHKDLETIYPPLAQSVFFIGALLKPNLTTQKALFALFDLATMVVILLLLKASRRNLNLCAIYGWNPLVLLEFSHSGHMDSLAIFFLMLAILLFQLRRRALGFLSIALSLLSKYLAVLLMPFFIFKRKYVIWSILVIPVVALGYLPFAGSSAKLTSSLQVYGREWYFNSLLFWSLDRLLENTDRIRMGLYLALGAFALFEGFRKQDLMRYAFLVIAFALLISPTVHPWYVCWIVPFLCFYRSRAWLYFTGAVAMSYWVWVGFHKTGEWNLSPALLLLEYTPFYLLLVYEGYRSWRRGTVLNR